MARTPPHRNSLSWTKQRRQALSSCLQIPSQSILPPGMEIPYAAGSSRKNGIGRTRRRTRHLLAADRHEPRCQTRSFYNLAREFKPRTVPRRSIRARFREHSLAAQPEDRSRQIDGRGRGIHAGHSRRPMPDARRKFQNRIRKTLPSRSQTATKFARCNSLAGFQQPEFRFGFDASINALGISHDRRFVRRSFLVPSKT